VTPIDILPDDVLLVIFDFYINDFEDLDEKLPIKGRVGVWLVHVCQRWRSVVLGSPRRMNLQLVCTPNTAVQEILDIWPAFPLVVHCHYVHYPLSGIDNILAALKYRDRVCKINIENGEDLPWEKFMAVMQVPLPELTDLMLASYGAVKPVLPNTFLGGSAPRLRLLQLDHIQFPALQTLLLSTTHLVHLRLYNIPEPGYLSPTMMVTCLSTLTSLKSFSLGFTLFPLPPAQKDQPRHLSTHSVLPALTSFSFRGSRSFLDDFVSRIDAPKLNKFSVYISHQFDRDTTQLGRFVSRTPGLQAPENAPRVAYL